MKKLFLILSFVCGMSTMTNAFPNHCVDFTFKVFP